MPAIVFKRFHVALRNVRAARTFGERPNVVLETGLFKNRSPARTLDSIAAGITAAPMVD